MAPRDIWQRPGQNGAAARPSGRRSHRRTLQWCPKSPARQLWQRRALVAWPPPYTRRFRPWQAPITPFATSAPSRLAPKRCLATVISHQGHARSSAPFMGSNRPPAKLVRGGCGGKDSQTAIGRSKRARDFWGKGFTLETTGPGVFGVAVPPCARSPGRCRAWRMPRELGAIACSAAAVCRGLDHHRLRVTPAWPSPATPDFTAVHDCCTKTSDRSRGRA